MDEQTMKDYIEDLLEERASLLERLHRAEARSKHLATELERVEAELSRRA
jgi:predicted nuclease with TOPRIM domain